MADDKPKINESTMIPIDKLVPSEWNPNVMSEEDLGRLVRDIRANGFDEPLQVVKRDENYMIVGGFHRYKACRLLGFSEIPCVVYDFDDKTAMEVCVRRNLVHGSLDHGKFGELLGSYLKGEKDCDWKKLAETFAVQEQDIMQALRNLGPMDEVTKTMKPADSLPAAPKVSKAPVTQRGDLWSCGKHVIMCGNPANPTDMAKLIGDDRVSLIVADPPPFSTKKKMADPEDPFTPILTEEEYESHLKDIFGNCLQFALPRTAWYVWYSGLQFPRILGALKSVEIAVKQQIIWVRPSPMAARGFFGDQHESCYYGHKEGEEEPPVSMDGVKAYFEGHESAVFGWKEGEKPPAKINQEIRPSTVWYADYDGDGKNARKIAKKPVRLYEIPILYHTEPDAICLDPFCGFGTMVIAGETLGRSIRAMDASPHCIDMAVRRWQSYTGNMAENLTRAVKIEENSSPGDDSADGV